MGESAPSGISWYYAAHAGSGIQHHCTYQEPSEPIGQRGALGARQRYAHRHEDLSKRQWAAQSAPAPGLIHGPSEPPGSINYIPRLTLSIRINRNK